MTSGDKNTLPSGRLRLRFTLRQLLLGVFVVALVLGIWAGWFRKVVAVRPARSDDPVYENYFGIWHDEASVRNIAVVTGTFTKSTWLTATLFTVQSGQCQEVNGLTVGRTTNAIGSLPWERMRITLAIGEWDVSERRVVSLGSAGQTRGGGSGSRRPVDIAVTTEFTETFTGSIWPGREYVIHAEGDTEIELDGVMTVEEFASEHAGNYLVVTAQLQ